MNKLPVDLLRVCVELDESTGNLYWKERPLWTFKCEKQPSWVEASRWNTRYSGKKAFNSLSSYGYLHGRLDGVNLYAHRVVWAVKYGNFPTMFIDHVDGNRTNNTLSNLREASKKDNNRNAKIRSDNKTGVAGVLIERGKFRSLIRDNSGRQISLGYFETLEEAALARKEAKFEYGYHPNHGRNE